MSILSLLNDAKIKIDELGKPRRSTTFFVSPSSYTEYKREMLGRIADEEVREKVIETMDNLTFVGISVKEDPSVPDNIVRID